MTLADGNGSLLGRVLARRVGNRVYLRMWIYLICDRSEKFGAPTPTKLESLFLLPGGSIEGLGFQALSCRT